MNVLLIVADDLRYEAARMMPFTFGQLAAESTEFVDTNCNVPICNASRAALLTGQYANGAANGIYQNAGTLPNETTHSLPAWLASHTAANAMFGKYLVFEVSGTIKPGWDHWQVLTNGIQDGRPGHYTVTNGSTPATHTQAQLSWYVGQLQSWLAAATGPFFAYWAPTHPHVSGVYSIQDQTLESLKRYDWHHVADRSLTAPELATKPSWTSSTPAPINWLRHNIRAQLRECWDLDQAIAQVYATLITEDLLDDTYIIFTSDNGVMWGEQNHDDSTASKDNPYAPATRVPLLIRGPGFPAGHKVRTLTHLADVTATICAMLGATPSVTLDGVDLATLTDGDDLDRTMLYERRDNVSDYPDADGIFTHTRKLIRYDDTGTDEFEMYDRDTDPEERINVANQPGRLTERNLLEAQLDGLLA